jgi:xanthine dehydrogenase YagT iron-sulfur-binding subunit
VKNELISEDKKVLSLKVILNGTAFSETVPTHITLAELLREKLNLTGTKLGCNRAECGVCTVLLDGVPVFSCTVLAADVNGRQVETAEGLMKGGSLHPLQAAFVEDDALQCGFCTPGLLMSLKALSDKVKEPTLDQVKEAIAGNYCRCGAYPNIFKAAMHASQILASEEKRNMPGRI